MAQSFYGSINFSKLLEEAKKGNKAFTKTENGTIYLNTRLWLNDEKDQYGTVASFQSNFKGAEKEDRFYFGNLKESTPSESPVNSSDIPDTDDLPF